MADAGADLIVGSHPHMVQRFSYIGAADGRLVPCAYSLGNFLTTMSELSGNRDSVILRVELTRGADGISAKYSYIPCMTEDRDWGAEIVTVSPPHSAESRASLQRTKEVIGKRINCYAYRPKVFLSGLAYARKDLHAGYRIPAGQIRTAALADLARLHKGCAGGSASG